MCEPPKKMSGWVLTATQARAIDRYAIEVLGLPGVVLMENAAINAASVVLDTLEDSVELDRDRFVVSILCGGGNNGGDGYAVARHLLGFGVEVHVFAAKSVEALTGDAAVNANACVALGISITACETAEQTVAAADIWRGSHAIVDGLLGTGFSGGVRSGLAGVIDSVNRVKTDRGERLAIVALDVPSGLDADAGVVKGTGIRADTTVTFVGPKAGFAKPEAIACLGRVIVADIGLPDSAIRAALEGSTGS
ncbi:MAG: NAD(P)H-hydrate epimerase [Planctomycetota bacterium]